MNYTESPSFGQVAGTTDRDIALLDKIMKWLQHAEGSTSESKWLTVSEEDYDFYAGDQDTAAVKAKLTDEKRPILVYDEIKPKVDVVTGLAGQNRQLPSAFPTEKGDAAIAEVVNNSIKFFRRETKFGDNELVCFEHTVKGGRSLLYFYIDDENPFEPRIKSRFVHGRNFKLDPRSVEYDMSDSRFLFIDFWYDKDEIKVKYPDFDPELVTQLQSSDGSSPTFYNSVEGTYRVTECWYKQTEPVMWVTNPVTKQHEKVSVAQYNQMKQALSVGFTMPDGSVLIDPEFSGIKRFATVYKYVIFSNYFIFEKGTSKFHWEGFPAILFGAFKNDKENRWFSLITLMKDPQKGINTMRRQMQHLLQTSPKGILMHEVGAILNIDDYEKKSAEPNFHLEIAQGYMEKVKFTDQPTISPVYGQLMQEDKQFLKDISGIQNDTLGIQTFSREPGITTQLRQGQNIAILFILLDNFKKSRLRGTMLMFSLMQQFVTSERLIRIEGPDTEQLMSINSQTNPNVAGFNDITLGKYDFYVEEGIETVNTRNSIAQMLIDLSQNNPGSIPPDIIIEYSGAPFSVIQKIKQYSEGIRNQQIQMEQAKAQAEKELEEARLENQRYIAVVNNLTKLIVSDKTIDGDLLKTLMSSLQQKQVAQMKGDKGNA
jgi:hypothetical protein